MPWNGAAAVAESAKFHLDVPPPAAPFKLYRLVGAVSSASAMAKREDCTGSEVCPHDLIRPGRTTSSDLPPPPPTPPPESLLSPSSYPAADLEAHAAAGRFTFPATIPWSGAAVAAAQSPASLAFPAPAAPVKLYRLVGAVSSDSTCAPAQPASSVSPAAAADGGGAAASREHSVTIAALSTGGPSAPLPPLSAALPPPPLLRLLA
jgi:hypothetical protein